MSVLVSFRDLEDHVANGHLGFMDYCTYQCYYCQVDGHIFNRKSNIELVKHMNMSHPGLPCKAVYIRNHSNDSQLDAFIDKYIVKRNVILYETNM